MAIFKNTAVCAGVELKKISMWHVDVANIRSRDLCQPTQQVSQVIFIIICISVGSM